MTYPKLMEPGGEINLKAKRRWEILRRKDSYRNDWDEAFAKMVQRLKQYCVVSSDDFDDFEGEQDPEKRRALFRALFDGVSKTPETWKAFVEKKWTPAKLSLKFLHYSQEGRELAQKYCLLAPYKYDDPLGEPDKKRMTYIFRDLCPIKIIPQNPTTYTVGPKYEPIFDDTPHLREGRFLMIEIDLHTTLGQIKSVLHSQLKYYRPLSKPKKNEKRDVALEFYILSENKEKVSIYELWDMCKKEGKTPWQITQILYPSKTNGKSYQPSSKNYCLIARRQWKQVVSDIEKADREINSLL